MTLNRGGLGVKRVLRAPEALRRAEMLRPPGHRAGQGAVAGHERVAHAVPHEVGGRPRRPSGGALARGGEEAEAKAHEEEDHEEAYGRDEDGHQT
jgi:hypothetical protein